MERTNATSCARLGTSRRRLWQSTSASGRCSPTTRRRASGFKVRRCATPKPGKGLAVCADLRRPRHNNNAKPAELTCRKKAFSGAIQSLPPSAFRTAVFLPSSSLSHLVPLNSTQSDHNPQPKQRQNTVITYAISAVAPKPDNARELRQTCRAPPELTHLPVAWIPQPGHARVLST